jgi:hypothetical protein
LASREGSREVALEGDQRPWGETAVADHRDRLAPRAVPVGEAIERVDRAGVIAAPAGIVAVPAQAVDRRGPPVDDRVRLPERQDGGRQRGASRVRAGPAREVEGGKVDVRPADEPLVVEDIGDDPGRVRPAIAEGSRAGPVGEPAWPRER